jgi:hypothetical protein
MKINPATNYMAEHLNGLTADDIEYIKLALIHYNNTGPKEVMVKDWDGSYPHDKNLSEHWYDNNPDTTNYIMSRLDSPKEINTAAHWLRRIKSAFTDDLPDLLSYKRDLVNHLNTLTLQIADAKLSNKHQP